MILSNASCFPDLQEGNFSALRAFSLKVDVKQQLRQTKGRGNKDDAQARVINTACKKKTLKRLINPQKKKIKYSKYLVPIQSAGGINLMIFLWQSAGTQK